GVRAHALLQRDRGPHVRSRQDALMLGALVLSVLLPGCGAVFHSSQKVTFVTEPGSDAVVYRYGAPLNPPAASGAPAAPTATVFLNKTDGFFATEPGKKVASVSPPTHVDGVAIGLDVLWCLTIVGVAAPIADGLLGTFSKVDDRVTVHLEPDPEETHPLPVYS